MLMLRLYQVADMVVVVHPLLPVIGLSCDMELDSAIPFHVP